jgi:hypothetical protein
MKQSKDVNVHIRHDWEYAKRTILNKGALPHQFTIHTMHGPVACLVQWETDDEKFMALAQIRLLFAGLDGIALSHCFEAWCADCSPDVRPSQAPNRIEVVQTAIYYRDDADEWHVHLNIGEIKRNRAGKPCAIKRIDGWDMNSVRGVFQKMFCKDVTVAERCEGQRCVAALRAVGILSVGQAPTLH